MNLRKCGSSSALLVEILEATQQRVHYKETDSAVYFIFRVDYYSDVNSPLNSSLPYY